MKKNHKITATKYTWAWDNQKLSGKKFTPGEIGSQLWVSKKNKHGYYFIGLNGTDGGAYFKRTTKKIHGRKYAAIKELSYAGSGPFYLASEYFTHYKHLK